MISIIFVAIALYVIFAKQVSLSPSFEIRRPKTYYWAVIILISVAIIEITGRSYNDFSLIGYIFATIILAGSVFFLKDKKLQDLTVTGPTKWKKVENIVAWAILGGIAVGAVALYVYDLIK